MADDGQGFGGVVVIVLDRFELAAEQLGEAEARLFDKFIFVGTFAVEVAE